MCIPGSKDEGRRFVWRSDCSKARPCGAARRRLRFTFSPRFGTGLRLAGRSRAANWSVPRAPFPAQTTLGITIAVRVALLPPSRSVPALYRRSGHRTAPFSRRGFLSACGGPFSNARLASGVLPVSKWPPPQPGVYVDIKGLVRVGEGQTVTTILPVARHGSRRNVANEHGRDTGNPWP